MLYKSVVINKPIRVKSILFRCTQFANQCTNTITAVYVLSANIEGMFKYT